MRRLVTFARLYAIQRVLLRHGLDEWLPEHPLLMPLRWCRYFPGGDARVAGARGKRLRLALEELGPIYVKFGQMLSTRRDLLPDDIAEELVKLQDRVPPFDGNAARDVIEKSLGLPVEQVFSGFSVLPLASASIAQVHAATLLNGDSVVVKVLRPDIDKAIQRDITLLYTFAGLLQRYWPEAGRLHLVEVVGEFDKTLRGELDLVREAANATELRRNFEHSEMLYIPRVYWDHTRPRVLVMERIHGIPVGDIARLAAEKADFRLLAERGVEIFFTQVFRDNFFHADMHPGNIFVSAPDRYIAVDFGIVGSLTLNDQRYLAENFLAFFNRDYRRVAVLHVQSGWVPADTRIEDFEAAIRAVCEPIFEKPLGQISYGHLLLRLFQTARHFNMEVQPQLVLLQKTLLNIEGLGRELYPDLDLWQTAKPYLENWYREKMGPKAALDKFRQELPDWFRLGPDLPGLAYRLLDDTANGRLAVKMHSNDLRRISQQLAAGQRRMLHLVSGGVLVILAATLLAGGDSAERYPDLAMAGGALGLLLMMKGLWRAGRVDPG